MTGFSGDWMSGTSSRTSAMRSAEALLIVSMTKIMASMTREIMTVIMYVNRDVRLPVVMVPSTMKWAPIHEMRMSAVKTASIMPGIMKVMRTSAFL